MGIALFTAALIVAFPLTAFVASAGINKELIPNSIDDSSKIFRGPNEAFEGDDNGENVDDNEFDSSPISGRT